MKKMLTLTGLTSESEWEFNYEQDFLNGLKKILEEKFIKNESEYKIEIDNEPIDNFYNDLYLKLKCKMATSCGIPEGYQFEIKHNLQDILELNGKDKYIFFDLAEYVIRKNEIPYAGVVEYKF